DPRNRLSGLAKSAQPLWQRGEWHFLPMRTADHRHGQGLARHRQAGGKVKMVGFDSGSQSVLDLKNGDVQGLVVQNPVLMGYLGVMTMVKHLRGEKVEKRIDTGVVLVTRENM